MPSPRALRGADAASSSTRFRRGQLALAVPSGRPKDASGKAAADVIVLTGLLTKGGQLRQAARSAYPAPPFTPSPPSTGREMPVINAASSEWRKRAALATSQPVPILPPRGIILSRVATTSARS